LQSVFLQGFWTNVLNPKVALFFLAFLPQFVGAEAPSKVLALLFLGLVFNVNGTLWNLFVAWSSARVGRAVLRRGRAALWFNRSVGALFVYLGARLALSKE
jgi:threonine/homoserine/homoserine lactone efflux protein